MYPKGQAEFYRSEDLEKGTIFDPKKATKKAWEKCLVNLSDPWGIMWNEIIVGKFGNGNTLDMILYSHIQMDMKLFPYLSFNMLISGDELWIRGFCQILVVKKSDSNLYYEARR